MAFINFENLPSENTPLTGGEGGNLNVMQEIVNISTEIDEDYRVNLIETKNLVNKSIFANAYYDYQGNYNANSNQNALFDFIKVNPNTSYTLSVNSSVHYLAIYEFTSDKVWIKRNQVNNASSLTATISSTTQYVRVQINKDNSTTMTQSVVDSLTPQFELGETATTYTPFMQNSMQVDGTKFTDTLNVGSVVDSRSRVNVLYSHNMIDFINGTYTNGNITAVVNNGTITLSGTSSGTSFVAIPLAIKFDLNNGSYYTISLNNNNTGDVKFRIENSGGYDVACSQQNAQLTIQYSNSKPLLKTIIYIRVADGVNTNGFILKPMINEGTIALDYEPYIIPSIVINGDKCFYSNEYLLDEVKIGTWLGKPLYRLTLSVKDLTTNQDNDINVPNYSTKSVVNIKGIYIGSSNNIAPINCIYASDLTNARTSCIYFSSAGKIRSYCGSYLTSNNKYSAYITIEYTKTTD